MTGFLNSHFAQPVPRPNRKFPIQPEKHSRYHCGSCEIDVRPMVDTQGLYCPWCQSGIKAFELQAPGSP